jgi:hypothetical protein
MEPASVDSFREFFLEEKSENKPNESKDRRPSAFQVSKDLVPSVLVGSKDADPLKLLHKEYYLPQRA